MRKLFTALLLWIPVAACTNARPSSHIQSQNPLANLGMNDVSVLWPLPLQADSAQIPALTVGQQDSMLSDIQYDHLPQIVSLSSVPGLIGPNPTNRELLGEMKVVAMRFDPCFRDVPATGDCQPQMRLVVHALQYFSAADPASNRDVALHLFYRLTTEELHDVLSSVVAARPALENPKSIPLNINPTLQSQGLTGSYAAALKTALSRFAKSDRLVRLAFMQLKNFGNVWVFGSFDVSGDTMSVVKIANIPPESDTIRMSLSSQFGAGSFNGGINPQPSVGDHAASVFDFSSENPADKISLVSTMLKIENPHLNAPGTVDCVSCHIAMSARESFVNQPNIAFNFENLFKSSWATNVINGPVTDDKMNRAFGYKSGIPAISQRVVNETAAVLEALQR